MIHFAFFLYFACLASLGLANFSPKRVVSLAPVITESMYALQAEDQLVGVTRFCNRPLSAQKIAKIGGFIDPQLEAVILLKPDLVIGMKIPSHTQLLAQLKKRKIETLTIENNTIADIRQNMIRMSRALNREKNATVFLRQFDEELANLKSNTTCSPTALILLVISSSPFIVAGYQTFANEVLELIGAKSAVPKSAPAWPTWSIEAMLRNPPRVIVATEGLKLLQTLRRNLKPILNQVLFKNTLLLAPEKSILQRPGPYLIEDIKQLIWLLKQNEICNSKKQSSARAYAFSNHIDMDGN
jgi:iron complex transport system substrate-binding protein